MTTRSALRALLIALTLGPAAACVALPVPRAAAVRPDSAAPELALMPLADAARRWGLDVERQTAGSASLRRGSVRVLVWAAPRGEVVVNGERLSDTGITSADGRLVLPRELVDRVCDRLSAGSHAAKPTLTPSVPFARSLLGTTVMVDAGHGGRDPGASNRFGPPEKEINLDAARRLAQLLSDRGARVLMTRSGDSFPSLDERVAAANRAAPDLFVSLHSDSESKGTVRGFTVYVGNAASGASLRAGARVVSALAASGIPSRGLQRANFRVVSHTHCPALLIEMGYLTEPSEARALSTGDYRQRLAEAIARGIADALGSGVGTPSI